MARPKRSPTSKLLARNVRELRVAKGFSQEQLADMMKMDRADVTRVESGQANPDLNRVAAFAKALGVTTAVLLGEDTTPVTV